MRVEKELSMVRPGASAAAAERNDNVPATLSAKDVVRLNTALQRQSDLVSCAKVFKTAISPLGFDTFACGEIDIANRARTAFYIVDWPDAWRRFYIQSGLIDRDPIVDELQNKQVPFTWTELRQGRKLAKAGKAALVMAADYGWTEGLVVPVPRGGTRYGLTSLVGRCGALSDYQRDVLSLACVALLSRVRVLAPQSGFPLPPAGLTPREIDCLSRVALGLTDQEIADALNVSRATAHQHVESAKRKMVVRSRAELVATAVSLGIIHG